MCDQKPQNCAEVFIFSLTQQIQIETIHKARNYPKLHENYIQEQTSVLFVVAPSTIAASVYFTMQLSVYTSISFYEVYLNTICCGCKYNRCFSLLYNAIISLHFNQLLRSLLQ